MKTIGVLAMQGAFREHRDMLSAIGVRSVLVRREKELDGLSGLILPGGESTTIGKLLRDFGLMEPLRKRIQEGLPVWGTCAGLILLARRIEGETPYLGLMDITAKRNAYGTQLDSFSTEEEVPFLGGRHPLTFIRAPYIEEAGPDADILLRLDGHIVAAREKNMLVTSFHPELTKDTSFHRYFADAMAQ